MPAPLSKDLRSRAVAAYKAGGRTYEEIAVAFGIGIASINRWLRLARERGNVSPRPHGGGRAPQIDSDREDALRALVDGNPDATLEELATMLTAQTGAWTTAKGVFLALQRLRITRKKRPYSPPSARAKRRAYSDGTSRGSASTKTSTD